MGGFLNIIESVVRIDQSISKRYKFLFATFGYFLLHSLFILFYSDFDKIQKGIGAPLTIFFLVAITLFLYPIVYQITFHNFLKIFSVPFGYVVSSFLLLTFFPNLNILFKFAFAFFSASVFYYLVLATNIFLVVEEKGRTIPLVRPAKTVFLLIEVITMFFVLTGTFKTLLPGGLLEVTFVLHAFVVFILSYFFAWQYWWSQNLEKDITSLVGNESLVIAFIVTLVSVALSFYSLESFFKSLAITTVYYVNISFFHAVVMHRVRKSLYLEFIFILIIISLFLLVS